MNRLAGCAVAAAVACAAAASAFAGSAATAAQGVGCAAPPALTVLGPALPRSAARIERDAALTIVAVGSSSTLGVGASSPALSYPNQLQAALTQRFPRADIRVINRGRGGEDAPEELARLDRDVVAEHPDLVIWQLGTNAVLRRDDLSADGERIARGIAELKSGGSDVVLMDLQYAPRVIAKAAYPTMEQLIAEAATRDRVGLFRRFEIMRYWRDAEELDAPRMIGPDGLHMNDAGYRCLAVDLARALATNWLTTVSAPPGGGAVAVAGMTATRPLGAADADAAR